jgi:arylsulfatase
MKKNQTRLVPLFLLFLVCSFAQDKPNVVLIFPDNLGVGEVSSFGGSRAVPTPNIDRIGQEGIRLTNFNVEYTCTPSRMAILTGRYATRVGEDYFSGATLWENTIAESLKSVGYATALFGKWDVGGKTDWLGKREPTHQGFDEWYGIPGTTTVSQFTSMKGFPEDAEIPYIWEGKAGATGEKVKPFDLVTRRTIDREAAERGIKFMKENVKQGKPFFLHYPMTQLHFPTLAHPDIAGSTGAGDMGDAMADVDYNVGLILDELKRLGIEDNTLVIWCSDNGAEMRRPWRGSSGPWRGYYNSAMEGGVRTPAVIRWPARIKSGQVSNELVHQVDLLPTIVAAAGATDKLPKDRILDGVNQLPFFEGLQDRSSRESAIFMNLRGEVMAVKWHDWKLWYDFKTEIPDPNPDNLVRLFDLRVDPQEEIDVKDYYPWVIGIMDSIVSSYELSLVQYPRVAASANVADPYLPPAVGSGKRVATYERTDRKPLGPRSKAMPNPDFSGSWSTQVLHRVSVINRIDEPKIPDLGSGWGDEITINHGQTNIEIEKVFFIPREFQPLQTYSFALDGSATANKLHMGRDTKALVSTTKWKDNRLEITTKTPYQDPISKAWKEADLIQTLWLEPPTASPWESKLIIETIRPGVLNGKSVANRTVYSKGYR